MESPALLTVTLIFLSMLLLALCKSSSVIDVLDPIFESRFTTIIVRPPLRNSAFRRVSFHRAICALRRAFQKFPKKKQQQQQQQQKERRTDKMQVRKRNKNNKKQEQEQQKENTKK